MSDVKCFCCRSAYEQGQEWKWFSNLSGAVDIKVCPECWNNPEKLKEFLVTAKWTVDSWKGIVKTVEKRIDEVE